MKMTINTDWFSSLSDCKPDVRARVITAVVDYLSSGKEPELKTTERAYFDLVMAKVNYDKSISRKRSESGKAGVQARQAKDASKLSKSSSKLSKNKKSPSTDTCEAGLLKQNFQQIKQTQKSEEKKNSLLPPIPPNISLEEKKSKEKEESISKEIQKKKEDRLDFVAPELREVYSRFVSMRSKIRKPIRTDHCLRLRYARAITLSKGDIDKARAIIQQSIDNEWQDFYELKSNNNNNNAKQINVPYSDDNYW